MPIPAQWPGIANSLQKWFGLKGGIRLSVDEIIVPTASVLLEDSPWASSIPCAFQNTTAALAANHSFVSVQPSRGVILRVISVTVKNVTGAAQNIIVRIQDPADVALMTDVNAIALTNLLKPIDDAGAVNRVGSLLIRSNHTAPSGGRIADFHVPDADTYTYVFRAPVYLDGDAKGGIGRCSVNTLALNAALGATFECREYEHRA